MFFRSDSVNSENAVARTMNTSMGGQQPDSTRFFEYLKIFVRFWGVLTAVVLGGVGVDLVYHRHNIGYYEISGAVIILVLEVLWVVTAFLNLFFRSDQSIWKWWMKVLWVENWKKSILYTPMAIVPLIWPQKLWLSYIASGQLIFLAFVHFLMSLKGRHRKKKRGQILNGDIDSVESRFDEGTDTRNDGLPEPIPGSSLSLADTFSRNNPIMEI